MSYLLTITDLGGKVVLKKSNIRSGLITLRRENINKGFYIIELKGEQIFKGRLVVE
jgi:hypothetical protein